MKIIWYGRHLQQIKDIRPRDKAGNVIDSNDNGDTKVCLVTDSKTVKEYQEHKKEYMLIGIISTLGIFIVISGSGLFIFTRRKRNLK